MSRQESNELQYCLSLYLIDTWYLVQIKQMSRLYGQRSPWSHAVLGFIYVIAIVHYYYCFVFFVQYHTANFVSVCGA